MKSVPDIYATEHRIYDYARLISAHTRRIIIRHATNYVPRGISGNRVEFILGPLLARPFALLLFPANAVGANRYVMGHSAQLVVILKPGKMLRAQK